MAEHLLDAAQIGVVTKQMRGEGVAQNMRADPPRLDTGGGRQFLQHLKKALPRHRPAIAAGK